MIPISIDSRRIDVRPNTLLLRTLDENGIYIPRLCYHPDLPPLSTAFPDKVIYQGEREILNSKFQILNSNECGLCAVLVEGKEEPVFACETFITEPISIITNNRFLSDYRKERLSRILKDHPHACLLCAQKEGCSLTQCSSNVPEKERCCPIFNHCELRKVSEYIGIPSDTPRYIHQNLPIVEDEPLFVRDYNLCIGCLRCVRACKDLMGVQALGFVTADSRLSVGTLGPTLELSNCRFCGICVMVCPTGALRPKKDFSKPLCVDACPVAMDVPNYIRAISNKDFVKAIEIISSDIPLTKVLGRICHHPCESACLRQDVSEPIAICGLKRFALSVNRPPSIPQDAGKTVNGIRNRVAIIGSGPCGLSCAFYLRKAGYSVKIFEAEPVLGGMLRYGIPKYRLPTPVLDESIDEIINMEIEVETNVKFGRDLTLKDILEQGFNAVFIAIGAGESKKIEIPGIDLPGVFWGVDFLKSVNKGNHPALGTKICIIGGGNVAIDCAMTVRRIGNPESIDLFALESFEAMPAFSDEISEAKKEGIIIHNGWGPKKIFGRERVQGIELVKCTQVFDEQGRFGPSYDDTITKEFLCDTVILAIGQVSEFVGQGFSLASKSNPKGLPYEIIENGRIKVESEFCETKIPGVFAGGEVVSGPGSVVEAISIGRKAALGIARYLDSAFRPTFRTPIFNPQFKIGRIDDFAKLKRIPTTTLPLEQRRDFSEIILTFNENDATFEAKRCLECDLRTYLTPVILPPEEILPFSQERIYSTPEKAGVVQLFSQKKEIITIKGTPNIRHFLQEKFGACSDVKYFKFEEDEMYTKRESELIQERLRETGKLPIEPELEDLF